MTGFLGNPIPLVTAANGFPQPVPAAVLRVVGHAIRHAWTIIESDPKTHLLPAGPGAPEEDIYSNALCHLMQQFLLVESPPVPGFTSAVFDAVGRCESIENFDGTSLNKNPDLVICQTPANWTPNANQAGHCRQRICAPAPNNLDSDTKGTGHRRQPIGHQPLLSRYLTSPSRCPSACASIRP